MTDLREGKRNLYILVVKDFGDGVLFEEVKNQERSLGTCLKYNLLHVRSTHQRRQHCSWTVVHDDAQYSSSGIAIFIYQLEVELTRIIDNIPSEQ